MTSRRDAFRLLGISTKAGQAGVAAPLRKKAIQAHPDNGGTGMMGPPSESCLRPTKY